MDLYLWKTTAKNFQKKLKPLLISSLSGVSILLSLGTTAAQASLFSGDNDRDNNEAATYTVFEKKLLTNLIQRSSTKKQEAFQSFSLEELLAEDGRLVNLIHRLPIAELSDRLLPLQKNWQDLLLDDLSLRTELPCKSLLDFLKEQEELQDTFQILEQIPAPIITIAIPTQGGDADFVAVAAATSWANEALHRTEVAIEYLSSHLGASFGLDTTGGAGVGAAVAAGPTLCRVWS